MSLRRRMLRRLIVAGLDALTLVAGALPWAIGVRVGGWLGAAAWAVLPAARRRAEAHLALALPELGVRERADIVARSFVNLGRSAFEILMLSRRSRTSVERWCTIEGEDRLKAAFAAGRGVIFLTGHCGNWELMAALVTRRGHPASVVATPVYDPRLEARLVNARARQGLQTISRGSPSAARQLLSCLRRNAILGMLIDQDTDVEGVFVPFFGRPAHTPSGAAALALKTGAPVLFGFIAREGATRHRLVITGPIELTRTGDHTADVSRNTACFTLEIERHIRAHPDEWVWIHDRWKRRQAGGGEPMPVPEPVAEPPLRAWADGVQ